MPTEEEKKLTPEEIANVFRGITTPDVFNLIAASLSLKETLTLHQVCPSFDALLKNRKLSILTTEYLAEYTEYRFEKLMKEVTLFENILYGFKKTYTPLDIENEWHSDWHDIPENTRIYNCSANLFCYVLLHAPFLIVGIGLLTFGNSEIELGFGIALTALGAVWLLSHVAFLACGRGVNLAEILAYSTQQDDDPDCVPYAFMNALGVLLGPVMWLPSSVTNPYITIRNAYHQPSPAKPVNIDEAPRKSILLLIKHIIPYLEALISRSTEKTALFQDILNALTEYEKVLTVHQEGFFQQIIAIPNKILLKCCQPSEELNETSALLSGKEEETVETTDPLKRINTIEKLDYFCERYSNSKRELHKQLVGLKQAVVFFKPVKNDLEIPMQDSNNRLIPHSH